MTYSKAYVDAVRNATNIVEIISEVIELKAIPGDRHKGLCPFHNESTPSFSVSNNLFHCFGCQEGGDAIRFIERTQRISFGAALRQLGDRYGILQEPQETPRTRWVGKPKKRPPAPIQMPEGWIPPTDEQTAKWAEYDSNRVKFVMECLQDQAPSDEFVNTLLTLGVVPSYLALELSKDVGLSHLQSDEYVPERRYPALLQEHPTGQESSRLQGAA